jgi:hypothetical protein
MAEALAALRQPTRYIGVADTAKLVRAALKKEFPGVKFRVRSSSYSGGASIDVRWTDGPPSKAVEKVAKRFEGSTFDGMIDLKSHHDSYLDGEMVSFAADYVFCQRDTTRALLEQVIPVVRKRYGIEATINEYGGWETGPEYNDRIWFGRMLESAWCDASGMIVAYVELR